MAILNIVLPVFVLIILGWVAKRTFLSDPQATRGLRELVFRLLMPSMLFTAITQAPRIEVVGVTLIYFAACLIVFTIALVIARIIKLSLSRAAMLGLNSTYGNTVMMGIPIVVAAYGAEALPPLLTIIALHSAVLLTFAGVLIEIDAGRSGKSQSVLSLFRTIGEGIIKNPVILSIFLAFFWRAGELPVPIPIRDTLRFLGTAATPLALISLGASLPPFSFRSFTMETLAGSLLKLFALPAAVWGFGTLAGMPKASLAVAILTAGMPTGANAFLLAHRSEGLAESSAPTVIVTMLMSLVTIYALLAVL